MKNNEGDDSFEMPDEADIPDETGMFLHSVKVLTAQQKLVMREQKTEWPHYFAALKFLNSACLSTLAASISLIVVAANLDLIVILISIAGYCFWKSAAQIATGLLNNRS